MTNNLAQSFIDACQARDFSKMELLLTLGADVNTTNNKQPLLVRAAIDGDLETMRWLLAHGADIHQAAPDGANALHCAAWYGKPDVARLLLEWHADTTRLFKDKTALQHARDLKHDAVAQILDNNPDQISFTWPVEDRTVHEVYDFPHRTRLTLIRKGEGGVVEAVQRESFAALAGEASLRKAFDEHRRRGGTAPEDEPDAALPGKARVLKREVP
jgi:ankyrin repeat protein